MKEYLSRLPGDILKLVHLVKDASLRSGSRAYLVGGFVRDLILGVSNFDLDIASEGNGIRLAEAFAAPLGAKVIAHARFGTATVAVKPHLKVDFATTRKEFYPEPGSLPVVSSGSLREDLARRDFTINAMAISLMASGFGELIDLFEGARDLKEKKVRILHPVSFIDDPTRILRAVRFEQRYGFRIEPATLARLKEAVKLGMLEKVQPQRLRDELILMLKEGAPAKHLKRLLSLGGAGFISRKLRVNKKTIRLMGEVEKSVGWFRREHHARRHVDGWLVYFLALMDGLSLGEVKAVCRKFVFRKGEEKRIAGFKALEGRYMKKLGGAAMAASVLFRMLEPLSYEAILMILARSRSRRVKRHIEVFLNTHHGTAVSVTGHDLRLMGIAPGPGYQKIFAKVLDAKLDGLVRTKEEEIALIKRIAKRGSYHVTTG